MIGLGHKNNLFFRPILRELSKKKTLVLPNEMQITLLGNTRVFIA
jgi:hypothetical protein